MMGTTAKVCPILGEKDSGICLPALACYICRFKPLAYWTICIMNKSELFLFSDIHIYI